MGHRGIFEISKKYSNIIPMRKGLEEDPVLEEKLLDHGYIFFQKNLILPQAGFSKILKMLTNFFC